MNDIFEFLLLGGGNRVRASSSMVDERFLMSLGGSDESFPTLALSLRLDRTDSTTWIMILLFTSLASFFRLLISLKSQESSLLSAV